MNISELEKIEIKEYIAGKCPVFINKQSELGYATYVVEVVDDDGHLTGCWLDAFSRVTDAISFCVDNNLPIKGFIR